MSKRKSLGSSPFEIGTSSSGSMGFIPDLGAGKSGKVSKKSRKKEQRHHTKGKQEQKRSTGSVDKKTVSYYLETRLISKVKAIAKDKEICYSALITQVLNNWLAEKEPH